MTKKIFTKPFTRQEPIPDEGIEAVLKIMKSGKLKSLRKLQQRVYRKKA